MTDGKIGVFDSGIGGLTVLKEIINLFLSFFTKRSLL